MQHAARIVAAVVGVLVLTARAPGQDPVAVEDPATALESAPAGRPDPVAEASYRGGEWGFWVRPDTSYVWGGDVDGPSDEIDVWINRVAVGAGGPIWRGAQLNLSVDYEHRRYDFQGQNDFFAGTDDPWRDVNSVGVNATILQALGGNWGALVGGSVRASAEAGADLFDGVSWSVLGGVGYQFSKSFRLGAGVALFKRIERSVLVVPVVQMDWKIDEQWRLKIEGPGAELSFRPEEAWEFALGARYASRWFRLEDDDVTEGGVAADRRLPVYARVTWSPDEDLDLSLTAGVDVYRDFEIADEDGDNRKNYGADPGVFIGFGLNLRF